MGFGEFLVALAAVCLAGPETNGFLATRTMPGVWPASTALACGDYSRVVDAFETWRSAGGGWKGRAV